MRGAWSARRVFVVVLAVSYVTNAASLVLGDRCCGACGDLMFYMASPGNLVTFVWWRVAPEAIAEIDLTYPYVGVSMPLTALLHATLITTAYVLISRLRERLATSKEV